MNSKKITLVIISTAVFLFIIFTVYFFNRAITPRPLAVLGQVQYFFLKDAEGKNLTLKDLTGKVWVANFFFTTCADICPVMNKHMAALNRSFDLVRGVEFVSFSVNPEYDSPSVLKQYAQKYQANPRWHFLTGSREDITGLSVQSFKLGDIHEPVFHSAYFTLVDRYGNIRGYYDGTKTEDVNRLFKDTAKLLKEK